MCLCVIHSAALELQSEEPFVVRLLFEPSGRPDSQQDYYLTAKQNLCVVCGKADSYIRCAYDEMLSSDRCTLTHMQSSTY